MHTFPNPIVFPLFSSSIDSGGSIGVEYIHIPDRIQCDWIRDRIEIPRPYDYSIEEKRMILDRLVWSDSFERFAATKFPSVKRFGLEGAESLIPGFKAMVGLWLGGQDERSSRFMIFGCM